MRHLLLLAIGLVAWAGCTDGRPRQQQLAPTETPPEPEAARGLADERLCVRVIDGDTIELDGGEKVRYIGIDTPETVHPQKPVQWMGKEASEANRVLVEKRKVRIEHDVERTDRYGRTLAYVWLGEILVNEQLVQLGYAQVSTYPPNVKYQERFLAAQRAAREAGRGLWGATPAVEETPAVRTPPTASAAADTDTVYVTNTGAKYHRGGCQYLRKSKIAISRKDAVAQGYDPCKVCKP